MPLRHSKPAQPRSTLNRTRSSPGSPAAAISSTPPCASRVWTPRSAIFTTRPSIPSSATTRFEPPPSTRSRRPRARAQSRAWSTAASLQTSTKNRAGPPTPSVQCSARWTFSSGVILLENIASPPGVPSHAALHPGIELIAQPVADQVDPEDQEEDGESRKKREPPAGCDVVAPLVQHGAPARRRRRDAQPEEAQRGLGDDRARHREGRDDGDGREHVGQDVAPEEIAVGRAERAGGLDELSLAQRERLAPHDSRVGNPTGHAEHENDVREACAEDGEHRDGQHEDGERE